MTIKSDLLRHTRDLYAELGGNELDRDRDSQAVRGSTTAGEFEQYMYKKKLARNQLSSFIDYVESRKRISRRDSTMIKKKLGGLFEAQKAQKLDEVTGFFKNLDQLFKTDGFTSHQKNLLGECEQNPAEPEKKHNPQPQVEALDSGDFMDSQIDQAIDDANIDVKQEEQEILIEQPKNEFTHAWHILLLIAISTILLFFFTYLFTPQ